MISVREQALAGLFAALGGVAAEVGGVSVLRNEDTEIGVFPALNLLDAESVQRVVDRAGEATLYALDVTIEGYVSAATPAETGPALSALYAATWRAAKNAETSVPAIDEVLEGEMETALVREDGVAPHAMFALAIELRFGALCDDPFTAA
jgi:hypothetical protein